MSEASDAFGGMVGRLGWFIGITGLAGAAAALWIYGLAIATGVAFGAVAAYCNMLWLARALEKPGGNPTRLILLRYALLAGAGYVTIKLFGTTPLAILAGLLTAVLAGILEILFQLFYART
jgi:hypothetical protein